jgi:hypothetical protein
MEYTLLYKAVYNFGINRKTLCRKKWMKHLMTRIKYTQIRMLTCLLKLLFIPYPHGATVPSGPEPPDYRGCMITLEHTTNGMTPLSE